MYIKGKGGEGELIQREGERGNISQSWVENTNMTECTLEIGYLPSINSDKHLSKSPITSLFFRWRHFASPSMSLIFLRCTLCRSVKTSNRWTGKLQDWNSRVLYRLPWGKRGCNIHRLYKNLHLRLDISLFTRLLNFHITFRWFLFREKMFEKLGKFR